MLNYIQIIIKYVLIYLVILSGSTFLSYKFDKKFCATLAPNILFIILVLYVFGLCRGLKYGVCFIVFLYLILGTYAFIRLIISHKIKNFYKENVGVLIIFSALFILFAHTTYEKTFGVWDEFTLWSIGCKNMYLLDDFITNHNCTFYLPYPPSPTILQYFFTKVIGIYSQGIELFASQILGFSLLFSLFNGIKGKINKVLVLIIILCIPSIFVESLFYYSIYVDTILGLMIGYILFQYFTFKKDIFMYISMGITFGVMSLTKPVGFFISLIVIGMLILYNILKTASENKKIKKFCKEIFMKIRVLIVFLLICFIAYFSWKIYVKMNNTNNQKNPYSVSNSYVGNPIIYTAKTFIKSFIGSNGYTQDNLSIKNLYYDLFEKDYYSSRPFNMSAGTWIFGFLIISVYIYKQILNKDKRNFAFFVISIFVGLIVYILFLQVAYIIEFSNEEAILHNSLQRYMGTFLTAMLFSIVGYILYFNNKYNKSKYAYVIITLIVLLFTPITPIANSTVVAGTYNSTQKEQFFYEKNIAERLLKIIPDGKEIYPVHQTSNEDSHLIRLRYFLTPKFLPITDIFGLQRNLNQIGASSVEEWQNILYDSYEYVYVLKSNEYFDNNYRVVFNNNTIEEWSLYKVEKDINTKTVLLIKTEY